MALLRLTPSFSAAPVVLASCGVLVAVAPLGAATAEAKRSFDLPRGDAATTLRQFAAASGRSLVFVTDKVRGETTNAVRGEFAPRDALDRMLADTGLEAAQDAATGAVVVSRKRTAEAAPKRTGDVRPVSDPEPKPKTMPMKTPRTLLAALAGWLVASTAAEAQVVATPSNEEPVQLSPFEVVAEKDNGYRASGTLAGTRLRTELKDVAASVSVITKDFMNDVGANNLADLLVYTTGTEVTGLGGNMSGADISSSTVDFDQVIRQPTSIVRIRSIGSGTAGADQARDYFVTDIPTDGYNLDRVEINRGPNAMLFGLGAPSGVVNTSLIKAGLQKNKTLVEFQYGQFGTLRGVLDHNQVLIKDRLAFRFSSLAGDQRYMQEPASDRNKRIYGTLTYKPFKNTTVKVSTEMGRRISNKPQARPPYEQVNNWFAMGKPVYDPTTGRTTFLGTPPPKDSPLYPINADGTRNNSLLATQNGMVVVNEDPNVRSLGITGHPGVIAMELGQVRLHLNFITTPDPTNPLVSDNMCLLGGQTEFLRRVLFNTSSGTNILSWNYWRTPQMIDPSVFDFYTQMLEGPNKYEAARWKTYNATIEQRLGSHAGLELALDWQQLETAYDNFPTGINYSINVDINSKLLDGTPNPNFGRPFWRIANGATESASRDRKGERLTGYYDLDLRPYAKGWLGQVMGRHIFTANLTTAQNKSESFGGRTYMAGLDYLESEQAAFLGTSTVLNKDAMNDQQRCIARLSYLGPSLINKTSAQNAGIQGLRVNTGIDGYTSIPMLYYQSPVINSKVPAQWQNATFSAITNTYWDKKATGQLTVTRVRSESLSKVLIANSRLLDDNLITTLGWRSDRFKAYDAGAAPSDPNTGMKITDWGTWYPKQIFDTTVNTFNYGIVGHTPRFIRERLPQGTEFSLTYDKSDNTSPVPPRINVDGSAVPSPTGKTQEMGARLSVLNGKLELRVVKFETSAAYATNSALTSSQSSIARLPFNTFNDIAAGNFNRIYTEPTPRDPNLPPTAAAAAAQKAWIDFFAAGSGKQLLDTFRYTNVGTANISYDARTGVAVSTSDVVARGWDYELVCNPTQSWRIAANASKAETVRSNTGAALNALADQLTTSMAGPAGDLPLSLNSQSPLRDQVAGYVTSIKKELALDGAPSPEFRKWRFNLVSNYTFSSGRLKGLKLGGAARWQDKIAISYPIMNMPTRTVPFNPQYDVKHPFFGPEEMNYDAWIGYSRRLPHDIRWSIQLNVKNIGVGKELIPVAGQPDGSVAAYRIAEPQTWSLTNRFEF